jgi:hypothetical protein
MASGLGIAGVVIAGVVLLWPLHANGVSGSALRPHYRSFGFALVTGGPLPRHVTVAYLRSAGVRLPQDVVDHRREIAYALVGTGLVVAVGGAVTWLIGRRERRDPKPA